jgi:hypothetical protein
MIESALLAGYLVFWGAMGLAPLDPRNWVLSSILPLTFVAALFFGRRSVPLSVTSYALITAFLALHTVGAHYTYAQVPAGRWLQGLLGLERNHFDRVTHFAFGLLLTYPLFDLFRGGLPRGPGRRLGRPARHARGDRRHGAGAAPDPGPPTPGPGRRPTPGALHSLDGSRSRGLARIMREHIATLTPTLSLAEGEGGVSIPSPPEGERDRVRGRLDAERAFVNKTG